MSINLKKEQQKAELRLQIKNLTKENKILQNVIHELIMNPESERSKGITQKVKQFNAIKK